MTQVPSPIVPTSVVSASSNDIPVFNIQRVYLKGTSFEMPNAPQIFMGQSELAIELNITPKRTELSTGVFEIVLHATLVAKAPNTDKICFLLEVEQAGIFEIQNIPAEHVEGLLNVRCPSILHNYLRVQVSDTLSRASLPSFIMPEIDWNSIIQQAQAEQEKTDQAVPKHLH